MTAISNGGAAQRVKVLQASDLKANGGQYSLEGRPPIAVYGVVDSATTAQGGNYAVMGNIAQPVYVVDAPTGAIEATIAPIPMIAVQGLATGFSAIPVYVMGGSLGGFSPADLENLVLWLDASDSTTLFQDTGATTPVTADGQSVARWNDKSISANNVTQSTSDNCPTRQTSGGYVGVRFDGINDNLTGMVINQIQNITLFCVIRLSDTSHHGAIFNNGNNGGWGLGIGSGTWDSVGNDLIWLWGDIQWRDSAHALGTGRSIVAGIADLDESNQRTTLRHNGVQVYQATGLVGVAANTEIAIGGYGINDRWFDDDILEVLVYTQVLDTDEISQVEAYLSNKWGITI